LALPSHKPDRKTKDPPEYQGIKPPQISDKKSPTINIGELLLLFSDTIEKKPYNSLTLQSDL